MRLNIGVIFGGKSVEHEISIISAIEAMGYADENKYKIIPIYIDKDNTWYTGEHLKSIINFRDIDLVKRYAKNNSIQRPLIQKLVGACHPAGARGIFVTTSYFSSGAISEARRSNIELIDGKRLMQLLNS